MSIFYILVCLKVRGDPYQQLSANEFKELSGLNTTSSLFELYVACFSMLVFYITNYYQC